MEAELHRDVRFAGVGASALCLLFAVVACGEVSGTDGAADASSPAPDASSSASDASSSDPDAASSDPDAASTSPDAASTNPDAASPAPDAEPTGDCTQNEDCASGLCTDNVCQTTRTVPCADVAPANATSTVVGVEITYTDAGGWSSPAACAWDCNANYFQEADTCINSRSVSCADVAPANATSTVVDVEITYTDAGGWTSPAACAWDCNADYFQEADTCINSRSVSCADVAPANATSTVTDVEITYTDAGGWTSPAACAWDCNADYFRDVGTCINERQVDCLDLKPDHGTSTIALVTIVYTDADGWSEPAACDFTCDESFCKSGTTCVYADFRFAETIEPGSSFFGGAVTPSRRNWGNGQGVLLRYPMRMSSFAFNFTLPFRVNGSGPAVEVKLALELRDQDGAILAQVTTIVPNTFTGGWVEFPLEYELEADTTYIFTTWVVDGYDQGAGSGMRADVSGAYADGLRYSALDTSGAGLEDWDPWFPNVADQWNMWFWLRATSACDG